MKNNIKEYGDLGSYTGNPGNTTGLVNPGMATYTSPDVSQNPINIFQAGRNTDTSYNRRPPAGITDAEIADIKTKVTPDEVLCGMDYELKRMFYKNKDEAKGVVVRNLRKDPKYYSGLKMLNLTDEPINESQTDTQKKAFLEIFRDIREKREKPNANRIVDQRVVEAYKETVTRINKKRNYGAGI